MATTQCRPDCVTVQVDSVIVPLLFFGSHVQVARNHPEKFLIRHRRYVGQFTLVGTRSLCPVFRAKIPKM